MREQPKADHKPARGCAGPAREPARPATGAAGPPMRPIEPVWPTTPAEARALQAALASRIERCDRLGPVRFVAGLDVHYATGRGLAFAAAVLLDAASLELLASVLAARPLAFPYVPGLLSFREAPVALEALALLEPRPDLLLVDGQGLAHPRRMGLACHIGLLADLPTIGVAKSRLLGEHAPLPEAPGAVVPLLDRGETVGLVLRPRAGRRPLWISIGHRVGLETALHWVCATSRGRRLPEPVRLADRLSRAHDP